MAEEEESVVDNWEDADTEVSDLFESLIKLIGSKLTHVLCMVLIDLHTLLVRYLDGSRLEITHMHTV